MKLLLTTIAAVLVVGCGESQQSAPAPESKPAEPVAEASQPEPPTAKAPDISIQEAAMNGDIEAVKKHLAAGTDAGARWGGGQTPLHEAAVNGHKEIAELLMANGADVNVKNDFGPTPLHWAADEGHKEIVELLIAKGADVNAKIEDGRTPLDMAIFLKQTLNQTEIADLLRKHGGKTSEELKAEGK